MANIVRMVNGGTVHVRTGVLQGIGPQGPRGLVGPAGPDGPQGPTGDTGPQGAIIQYMSRADITTSQTVNADTDTTVAFASVAYDDLDCFVSSTAIHLTEGDYLFSVWVRFSLPADAGDGTRYIWITSTSGTLIARDSRVAVADDVTYVSLSHPVRVTDATTFNVKVRSGDNLSAGVSLGQLTVVRIGSGPAGATGATGPAGPAGPTGPAGPQGDDGDASSGFATYADLL